MKKPILAIYDREEAYSFRLSEYLSLKNNFPFHTQVFTNASQLIIYSRQYAIQALLIGESVYSDDLKKLTIPWIYILTEKEQLSEEQSNYLLKYQSAENILKNILRMQSQNIENSGLPNRKIISVYSPVGRCLQTSFSLVLGQLLARSHRVLYLNFEHYSGFGALLKRGFHGDMGDLIFYLHNGNDKFGEKFESMVQKVNHLDFIPPALVFSDLLHISAGDWQELISKIQRSSDYEYIILDLSDGIQGLYEILRYSNQIYTIAADDGFAMAKISQYEEVLKLTEYEDILKKSKKWKLPRFSNIPIEIEQLPYSELAEYVKEMIREDFGEN